MHAWQQPLASERDSFMTKQREREREKREGETGEISLINRPVTCISLLSSLLVTAAAEAATAAVVEKQSRMTWTAADAAGHADVPVALSVIPQFLSLSLIKLHRFFCSL